MGYIKTSDGIPIHYFLENSPTTPAVGCAHSSEHPSANNFLYEIYRVTSFPDYVPFHKSLALAKQGFHFCSDGDKICCTFCSLQCSLPSNVHQQHNPEICAFLRGENVGNIPIPELSGVNAEANRLCSFLAYGWPKLSSDSHPVGALELARNGFYYFGSEDAARCAFCRLEIRGWESGDTAEAEHKKWNPSCIFLRSRSLVHNIEISETRLHGNIFSDHIPTSRKVSENEALQQLGIKKISPPKHPKYQIYSERLKTYSIWPKYLKLQAQHLCEAGFYYTDCSYLNLKKSPDFVLKVQQSKNSTKQQETQEQVMEEAVIGENIMEVSDERKSRTDESHVCKVCMSNEIGVVFLPCGHMSSCTDCAAQLHICPICRKQPTAYLRAYLP
ncbi:hypothetical protein B566_EDAN015757 [Ephemera danica]|nr:hypothetical protein B566_EDAN015757 [Ephemera danica]